jgi:hypothetical protein
MWSRVALERIDVSEERFAYIIRAKIISEPGTTSAVTSKMIEEWCLLGCYAVWLL